MSQPLRPIFPKADGALQPHDQTGSNYGRRDAVLLACQKCRARKVKCDGHRPSCSPCRSRGFRCEFKDKPNETAYTDLKRRFHELEQQHMELVELYDMLKSRPEAEAYTILQRLRSKADVHSITSSIKEADLLVQHEPTSTSSRGSSSSQPSFTTETLLNIHHPNAYPQQPLPNGETADSRPQTISMSGTTLEEHKFPPHKDMRDARANQWTTVTNNDHMLANFISLYLSWDHASLRLFDEDYFLEQMVAVRTEYCSPLLVNAILAVATLNYSAIDAGQSRAMGHAFFEEAKRIWASEVDELHVLKIPAALLMTVWCNWNDMKEMGSFYLSQATRVALNLGFFHKLDEGLQSRELESRKRQKAIAIVAWGLFNFQTINRFFRLIDPHLIGVPKFPIPYDAFSHDDTGFWDPFPLVRSRQVIHRGLAFKAFAELCKVLNKYLSTQDPFGMNPTFEEAKAFYEQMLVWADNLPSELVRSPQSLPMVLDLHMFYHGILARVFRPFIGNSCPHQESARTVMKASLNQLKHLLCIQRHHFDGPPFNATTIGSVHILTFPLLEDMARSDDVDPETSFHLVLAAEAMKKYTEAFPAIRKTLHALLEGASRQQKKLPREIQIILEELSARSSSYDQTESDENRRPIDLQVAITDHEGKDIEELVKVTYGLQLDSDEPLQKM
ncbi:hypothetical protein F5Y19DRAFT_477789 [Xylariaceae sp. FL1651]|nr:hypothetical protein F5Y19DRAFT_477789 [Xylariaceae sp. FL1651]